MSKLSKLKTAELRKLAEQKEIDGWEEMNKKELLAVLETQDVEPQEEQETQNEEEAEEKEEEQEEAEEKTPSPEVANDGVTEKHVAVGSKAELMKERLSKQPKVRILIPLTDEKMGATLPVTINGYRLNIMKGVYVDVPQQVADVVMESQKQTVSAANNALNLTNPEHPKKKSGEGIRDLD